MQSVSSSLFTQPTRSNVNPTGTSRYSVIINRTCTSIKLRYAAYCSNGANPPVEMAVGNSINVSAAIEISGSSIVTPETVPGVLYPLTFGGQASGTVMDGGTLDSDELSITLLAGQRIFIRTDYAAAGSGYYPRTYHLGRDSAGADAWNTTQRTSASHATALVSSGLGYLYTPMVILGTTARDWPSIAGVGDSIIGDDTTDVIDARVSNSSSAIGYKAGDGGGYLSRLCRVHNIGLVRVNWSGERGSQFTASGAAYRLPMIPECKIWNICYGTNDLAAGATAVQIEGYLTAIGAMAIARGATPVYNTIPPRTSMSVANEAWGTANQTVESTESVRVAVNTWVRSQANYWDIADVLETSRNSGIWKVGPVLYTGTVSSSTSTVMTFSSRTDLVGNQIKNYVVTLTGGTGAGQTRAISSNQPTSITVAAAFSPTPDNTTTWEVRPAYTSDGIHPSFYANHMIATTIDPTNLIYAAVGDVRTGTKNAGQTGTCSVPNPAYVSYGVAVDNTTGTAALTAQNVADAMKLAPAAGTPATGSVMDLVSTGGDVNVTQIAGVPASLAPGVTGVQFPSTVGNSTFSTNGAVTVAGMSNGVITSAAFATDAITAAAVSAGAVTKIQAGLATSSALAAIAGATVTLVSPVSTTGTITLIQGDDYKAADGRAITYSLTPWTVAAPSSAKLRISNLLNYEQSGTDYAEVESTGTVSLANSILSLSFDLTAAQTSVLDASPNGNQTATAQVVLTDSGGDIATPITAVVNVTKRITASA